MCLGTHSTRQCLQSWLESGPLGCAYAGTHADRASCEFLKAFFVWARTSLPLTLARVLSSDLLADTDAMAGKSNEGYHHEQCKVLIRTHDPYSWREEGGSC